MREQVFRLTVLGSRGSMASGRAEYALFGGDTSCYRVEAGEETIFLDAGSGLTVAFQSPKPPVILLSHLHLDHVMGLGMFPGITDPERQPRIYVPFCRDRQEAQEHMGRVYSPPIWPLRLEELEGRPQLLPLPKHLTLGEVSVDAVPGNHPDGCMAFRLEYRGKSLVYATDYEYEPRSYERLAALGQGADLLMVDAQYDEAESRSRKGFGHSSAQLGLRLLDDSGAKRLLLIHHDPWSTDSVLLEREKALPDARSAYAREGQVIEL